MHIILIRIPVQIQLSSSSSWLQSSARCQTSKQPDGVFQRQINKFNNKTILNTILTVLLYHVALRTGNWQLAQRRTLQFTTWLDSEKNIHKEYSSSMFFRCQVLQIVVEGALVVGNWLAKFFVVIVVEFGQWSAIRSMHLRTRFASTKHREVVDSK